MEAVYCMPPMIVRDYSPRLYPGVIWIVTYRAGEATGTMTDEHPPGRDPYVIAA